MNGLTSTQGAVQQRPFIVGLTGGIASGKSTVSRYLAEQYAIPIIDTDIIARQLVAIGSPTLQLITEHFGTTLLDEQGQLKRRQLRDIIAQNPEERLWLNELMHPRIYDEVVAQVKQLSASSHPYIMIVIPLLNADSPYLGLLNAVWVVDCDEERQKQHLIARDDMSAQTAQQLINAQPSRQERVALATAIIENDGSTEALLSKTQQHHQNLLSQCLVNHH